MNTQDRLKMVFGFLTILIIAGLAVMIGYRVVEQQTSYGLEPILVALTAALASFCNWAFSRVEKSPELIPEDKKDTNLLKKL